MDACECVLCTECRGTGTVYYDAFTGKYLGASDWEGWNHADACPFCGGSGFEYECDECLEGRAELEEAWEEEVESER